MFIQISTKFGTLYEFLELIKQKQKLENDLPATGPNLSHERGPQDVAARSTRQATWPWWAALAGPAQGCHRLSRPRLPARRERALETVAACGAPTVAQMSVVDRGPRCGGDSGLSTRSPGEGAGHGKRGWELMAGPCVGEATTGGGAEAFVGSEWSAVAGEGRGMLLRLKGKERTVWRGQMCANRVRGGGSPECVAGGDAPAQNSEGKRLPVVEMGKTGSGNRGRLRCPRARMRGAEEWSQRKGRRRLLTEGRG
jgi:hypothetical protein